MACGNVAYLSSLSGIFRLLTVISGIPAMILAWIAYFSSSWAKTFPEILAIIAAEKTGVTKPDPTTLASTSPHSQSSTTEESDNQYDLISDKEEELLDEILLQTLMYEKFFIGLVTVVFLLSAAYLIVRVVSKHQPDSPYEIMFDFIFHVLSALGLLTGSALVLLSAAKIQTFVEQVSDDFPPGVVDLLHNAEDVQDKTDKIAAAVIAMLNGILYALCVVTIRMTKPISFKKKEKRSRHYPHSLRARNSIDRYSQSGTPADYHIDNDISYGFYGNPAYFGE